MKKWNQALFISFFFMAILILATGCPGENNQTGMQPPPQPPQASPTPSPAVDFLALAQQNFKDKVFPFFNHPRCVNCHDFIARAPTFFPAHTINPADNCMGCHSNGGAGVLGWTAPPIWGVPPVSNNWVENDDPLRIRNVIISIKGPDLYKHLVGTGADADEFVQWCFQKNPPFPNGGPPDAAPPVSIKPGSVPFPFAGQAHPTGQIPDNELLNWPSFQLAIDEWICRESRIPGAPDLGKPASLDCSVFP